MTGRLDQMVWVKQVLNVLILLCIPLGSFFAWGKVNNQISYKYEVQGPDFLEKQASRNWTENEERIMSNIEFHGKAARATLFTFVLLVVVRIVLSVAKSHSVK